jgi:polyhydroxyalkanoate synthesis regulator phasin
MNQENQPQTGSEEANMVLDFIRKGIYAGIGAFVVTGEEMRKTVNRFVEAGRMTVEDSEELIRELSAKGDKQQEELQKWLADLVRSIVEDLDIASRREIEALATRLKNLEGRVALMEDLDLRLKDKRP